MKVYVKCIKCGKVDKPHTDSIPYNVGTSTKMRCQDCSHNKYGIASMCRVCCPTGHGTRF